MEEFKGKIKFYDDQIDVLFPTDFNQFSKKLGEMLGLSDDFLNNIRISYKDEDGKTQRTRKLVGRLDENNEIVPTSGRRGRLPKKRDLSPKMNEPDVESQSQIDALRQEIQGLKSSVASLQKEKQILINGIKRLLDQVQ